MIVDYGLQVESINLSGTRVASFGERMIGVLESRRNSGHVLVHDSGWFSDFALCDLRRGKCKHFSQPAGKAIKWAFDSKGELRAVTLVDSRLFKDVSTVSNWYKPAAGENGRNWPSSG
ncbi:hypothetical protein [Massilia consociata]|uniref:hypothetical protein n=1 Tax=Massilia consociata TaxID=760117 RepID=UPI0036D2E292